MFSTGASTSFAQRPTTGLFGGSTSTVGTGFGIGVATAATSTGAITNANKDFEVSQPPNDSVQALKFSPAANFLASGSWDNVVRVWDVAANGTTTPKAEQTMQGPVLEIDWSDDGSKIFVASADRQCKMWDLQSNQMTQIAQHDAPIKTCNWVKGPNYQCVMTGSWDKTLKFWDTRTPTPSMSLTLPERIYAADVIYPMAIVSLAPRTLQVYKLDGQPSHYKDLESQLKFQHRCVSVFKDKTTGHPNGFAVGSIEGRVAIHYVDHGLPKDNFTFKCHRSAELNNGYQDIYPVNDIAFHPVHGTLATVGSDGRFSFWDKDARTKLKTSEPVGLPINRCCFNRTGDIFAYSVSYDWSKGHEYNNPAAKCAIFLRPCMEDMKPRQKK